MYRVRWIDRITFLRSESPLWATGLVRPSESNVGQLGFGTSRPVTTCKAGGAGDEIVSTVVGVRAESVGAAKGGAVAWRARVPAWYRVVAGVRSVRVAGVEAWGYEWSLGHASVGLRTLVLGELGGVHQERIAGVKRGEVVEVTLHLLCEDVSAVVERK